MRKKRSPDRPETFWVVWSPQGGDPVVKFSDFTGATRAARCLKKRLPAQDFYVLRSCWRSQLEKDMNAAIPEPVAKTDTRSCDLADWFPPLQATGVLVPRTAVIKTDLPLIELCDGKEPEGFEAFLAEMKAAAIEMGLPIFLRTGFGSDKHSWKHSCFVEDLDDLKHHIGGLVSWSCMVDFFGLPTSTWVIREFLSLRHEFTAFQGMPVAREFRCFVRDGKLECLHPYWPARSIITPSRPEWQDILEAQQTLQPGERETLQALAEQAGQPFLGLWSIDLAQHADGRWLVTDLAVGEKSFHWEECERVEKREPKEDDGSGAFTEGLKGPSMVEQLEAELGRPATNQEKLGLIKAVFP